MAARREGEPKRSTMERKSERELVVTRSFDAPARLVFEAWTTPELFQRWWVPASFGVTVLSFEADIRPGGRYRLVSKHGDSAPMEFFGTYLEVTPYSRLVWTNDEGEGQTVTTVRFEEESGKTRLIMTDLYPTKQALDAAMVSGEKSGLDETFAQLDRVLSERS